MSDKELFGLDKEIAEKIASKYDQESEQKAKEWIESITGVSIGADFWGGLKDGAILCQLINIISPGSCPTFAKAPKHWLEQKDNIKKFLSACKKIGMPDQDMMSELDMSDSKKDPLALLTCIFGLARQAQAIGFNGPSLGVKYYKTREDQIELERKREKERQETWELQQKKREERDKRRQELEQQKVTRQKKNAVRDRERVERRQSERKDRGRKDLVEHETMRSFSELDKSPSPVRFGMDLEHRLQKEQNHSAEERQLMEEMALDWIEDITGEEVDHLYLHLKSGRTLCKLMNRLQPGSIKKINKGNKDFFQRENLAAFRQQCQKLGLQETDIFDVDDLYKKNDLGAVINTLFAISRSLEANPNYTGPTIRFNRKSQTLPTAAPPPTPVPKDRNRRENEDEKLLFKDEARNDVVPKEKRNIVVSNVSLSSEKGRENESGKSSFKDEKRNVVPNKNLPRERRENESGKSSFKDEKRNDVVPNKNLPRERRENEPEKPLPKNEKKNDPEKSTETVENDSQAVSIPQPVPVPQPLPEPLVPVSDPVIIQGVSEQTPYQPRIVITIGPRVGTVWEEMFRGIIFFGGLTFGASLIFFGYWFKTEWSKRITRN